MTNTPKYFNIYTVSNGTKELSITPLEISFFFRAELYHFIIFSLDLRSILKINIPSKGNALEEIQAREELNSLNFFSDRED